MKELVSPVAKSPKKATNSNAPHPCALLDPCGSVGTCISLQTIYYGRHFQLTVYTVINFSDTARAKTALHRVSNTSCHNSGRTHAPTPHRPAQPLTLNLDLARLGSLQRVYIHVLTNAHKCPRIKRLSISAKPRGTVPWRGRKRFAQRVYEWPAVLKPADKAEQREALNSKRFE